MKIQYTCSPISCLRLNEKSNTVYSFIFVGIQLRSSLKRLFPVHSSWWCQKQQPHLPMFRTFKFVKQ